VAIEFSWDWSISLTSSSLGASAEWQLAEASVFTRKGSRGQSHRMQRRSSQYKTKDRVVSGGDVLPISSGSALEHKQGEHAASDSSPRSSSGEGSTGAQVVKKHKTHAEESTENCPLFTDIPISKVRAIEIHGMIDDGRSVEAQYLDEIEPTSRVADIKAEFGGGRFLLKAIGEGQQPLEERQISIGGPVVWIDDEEQHEPPEPAFGARFRGNGRGHDPRNDPRSDPRLPQNGYDPRYGQPPFGAGPPFGGSPWSSPRSQMGLQQEALMGKLLDAFISKPTTDASASQAEIQSLRNELERQRTAASNYQNDLIDLRRKYNDSIDEERSRSSKRIQELQSELDKCRQELHKEAVKIMAYERKIMEMELSSKFSKDGSGGGGFDMSKIQPLMPILGVMVSKLIGLSPDEAGQLAQEQNAISNGASSIPGIPSE
jgi:hypothetical protein